MSFRSLRATLSTKASDSHRTHSVGVEHFHPSIVINVSNGLTPSPHDASVVEEDVDGLPVKFRRCSLDTEGVSDIQGQDPQVVVVACVSQSMQLGSGTWITTSSVNLPAIGQKLSDELEPNPAIGSGDQGAWHRMLIAPRVGSRLVWRHILLSQFFDRLLVF